MKCKCKQCGQYVDKLTGIKTPAGFFCCFDHAIQFSNDKKKKLAELVAAKARSEQKEKDKQTRISHRKKKVELKNIFWHRNRAKRAYQDWRRISLICEFLDKGEAPKCFSCGTETTIQWQAGHYRPAGVNSAIMFCDDNVWLQCKRCNEDLAGNLTAYRVALVDKIGEEAVKQLENNHDVKKWTREEFTVITETYREKLKELKNKHNI